MRYFVGFLIAVGLIIVLIVLLLTGGHGGNGNKQLQTTGEKPQTVSQLAAYADTDVVTRVSIDGPINASQNHMAVRITVGREDVTYEQIQGYEGTVVNKQAFANNQNAYSNFLYAIGRAGFNLGDSSPKLANEKGFCSTGQRYVFELADGNHDIQRYWQTNCGSGTPKTYKGNLTLTLELFQVQVPGYNDLTQDLNYLENAQ
jgi:uncharacterized protein (UPF0333 family)